MNIENLEFLNLNSLRNYPLKDGVSRRDSLGAITLPNTFITDAKFAISALASERIFISKLSNLVSVIVIDVSNSTNLLIGSFTIDVATHTLNKRYYMAPTSFYVGAVGVLTVGDLSELLELFNGTFLFSIANTEFETRTITPSIDQVTRITFKNADGITQTTLTGDVAIIARANLRFKPGDPSEVILDAGNGLGLNTDCEPLNKCIKTINGVSPDDLYNFTLDASECASFSTLPSGSGLLLEDGCCKPCVGCNDISILTTRLMDAESKLLDLRNYYDSLNNLFTEFKASNDFTCNCPPSE